jgi:hypothetical protein
VSEYDDLLERALEERESEAAETASPAKRRTAAPPEQGSDAQVEGSRSSSVRRGMGRLAERRCPRWMYHREGEYCHACDRIGPKR